VALNAYITQVQDLLHDAGASFYPVALFTVVGGGTGYTAPVVSIGGTGTGATATATQIGGVVQSAITVTNAGLGYAAATTTVTITDPTGTGATATAVLGNLNQTSANQEVYPFSVVNPLVALTPGVSNILGIKQIAVSWGTMKPALGYRPWRLFNAYYRAANVGPGNLPVLWSQYGQGEAGSIFLYQIPSSALAMDWDCICEPLALAADTDPEALPAPFTDAVQYYATYLALLGAQRADDAEEMFNRYMRSLTNARATAQADIVSNYYNPMRY
jgi:hypothetical protein